MEEARWSTHLCRFCVHVQSAVQRALEASKLLAQNQYDTVKKKCNCDTMERNDEMQRNLAVAITRQGIIHHQVANMVNLKPPDSIIWLPLLIRLTLSPGLLTLLCKEGK